MSKTLANLELTENTCIILPSSLSADGKYAGIAEAGTLGETIAFGDIVYFKASDSRWWRAQANADATSGAVKLGCCVLAGAAAAASIILLQGKVRADANFPAMTIGAPLYISGSSAGDVVTAQPTTTDYIIRIVGFANTADELYFRPSPDYITHT